MGSIKSSAITGPVKYNRARLFILKLTIYYLSVFVVVVVFVVIVIAVVIIVAIVVVVVIIVVVFVVVVLLPCSHVIR